MGKFDFDIMSGFNVGSNLAKTRKNAFKVGADTVMDNFKTQREYEQKLGLERAKSAIQSPEDIAKTRYYNAQSDYLQNPSNQGYSSTDDLGIPDEDLYQKPTVTRYRGKMMVQNAPTLKDPLGGKETGQIEKIRKLHQGLSNNLKLLTPATKKGMNPFNPAAHRGPIGNTLVSIGSMTGLDPNASNFATFKAETDKVFQGFRSDVTGAQAALKELGWLEPDFPQASDTPDIYISKAQEALKRLKEGEKLLLDTYSQRGFRTSALRGGGLNPLSNGGGIEQARQEAIDAINKGAPGDKVAERFKQKYGVDLNG